VPPALADQAQPDRAERESAVAQDLKRLSIEELAELDVTSVSRRIERLSQAAAAISVVRQEDIRRSGVASLAEAMRLADALDVARSDGRTWNITARGFNIVTANKLLVRMDGRTLYSPLFAGTFWDVQDMILADIDRIEVIRGPGGTIWGANAVNGVINIITRDASQTRGNVALLATGTENQLIASARHGERFAAGGSFRVYGKFRRFGANVFADGIPADDELQTGQLGIRVDSNVARPTRWSLQGNIYTGTEGFVDRDDTNVRGAFVLGEVTRRLPRAGNFQLRSYYDHTYRRVPLQFEEGRHTYELDVQHNVRLGGRHAIVLGGKYRVTTARDSGGIGFSFEPERRTNHVGGVFLQDEITLRPDLALTLGAKLERNDYTGLEVQPTVRARWNRGERQTVWSAVSRAVRLPTRFDTDLRLMNPATGEVVLSGREDFLAESVVAYELGYRTMPRPWLALDLAGFVNRYDNLRSQEAPVSPGAPVLLGNTLEAVTSGLEAAAHVQVSEPWRVRGSFASLRKRFTRDPDSRDVSGGVSEGNDPGFLFSLRSYLDLPHGLTLDGFFRHVPARPDPAVPAYSSLDLRLGWMIRSGWEVSLIGQNLLDARHAEFGAPTPTRTEFQRGIYVRSAWYF